MTESSRKVTGRDGAGEGSSQEYRRGFTLIEMAIVLVIIGLIVGGILVGQSMIQAATVRNQIKQMQDLQTQIAAFYGKYYCLPGDCPNATTFFGTTDANGHSVSNGDGDGLIRSTLGAGPFPSGECLLGQIPGSELPQAFLQLNDGGIGNYVSDGTGNSMNVGWGPLQAINNGTGLLLTCLGDAVTNEVPVDTALNWNNVIVLGAYRNDSNPTNLLRYITGMNSWGISVETPIGIPTDIASMIDQKLDDGLPASGNFGVLGGSGSSWRNPGTPCLTNSNTTYPALGTASCTLTVGLRLGQ